MYKKFVDYGFADREYPKTWYVLEVKFDRLGNCKDISIAYVKGKPGISPVEKDNSLIYATSFLTYEQAERAAKVWAKDLDFHDSGY